MDDRDNDAPVETMMLQKYSPISGETPNMQQDSASGTFYWCEDVHALLKRIRDAIEGDERSVLDEINSVLMVR